MQLFPDGNIYFKDSFLFFLKFFFFYAWEGRKEEVKRGSNKKQLTELAFELNEIWSSNLAWCLYLNSPVWLPTSGGDHTLLKGGGGGLLHKILAGFFVSSWK